MVEREKIEGFLTKHGLAPAGIDIDQVLSDFQDEMQKGLAGEESSLRMIPTFITADRAVPAGKPVIVLDAGGTNLRVATVTFDESGNPDVGYFEKHPMAGVEKELTATEFFGKLAGYIAPIVDASDEIGFCFSYPTEISPERDGKLLRWTKEVKAPEVEGQYIGKGLRDALGDKGAGKNITILNDTIATLLAGKSGCEQACDSYVGFILGTGTNAAYVEKNAKITKRDDLDADGSQAINEESGNFNRLPRGDLDLVLDATTADPGKQVLEKMISGRYLGDVVRLAFVAAGQEGLLSDDASTIMANIREMEPRDMDLFLAGSDDGALPMSRINMPDCEIMTEISRAVVERAAKITAVNVGAAVLKAAAGHVDGARVCVTMDGSTYYKTAWLKDATEQYLQGILGPWGVAVELVQVDDAPLLGVAIAGLTH